MIQNGCGTRHLKLCLWILGVTFSLFATSFYWSAAAANALDVRVRGVEVRSEVNKERFMAILKSLERIETIMSVKQEKAKEK